MSSRPTSGRGDFSMDMRKRSGAYLRSLREKAGLTQVELARAIGVEYYTAVSQWELGRTFCPPERYQAYAEATGVDVKDFVRDQLRFQNPWAWAYLFGTKHDVKVLEEAHTER